MSLGRRTFIVGDVHGCFKNFQQLLKKAEYQLVKHRLILLGDLINKGPDSFKMLKWLYETKTESVIGNHEWKFIQAVKKGEKLSPVLEGLKAAMGKNLKFWLEWIKSWPVYIEEKDFLAVHGGLVPGEHPGESDLEQIVNIRCWDSEAKSVKAGGFPAWHDFYTASKLVVYGHWAKQGLKIKKNSICLDTGCVYGGCLTGLWLPERRLVQVKCQ